MVDMDITTGNAVQLPYDVLIDMNDMGNVQLAFVVILALATLAIAMWIEDDKRAPVGKAIKRR